MPPNAAGARPSAATDKRMEKVWPGQDAEDPKLRLEAAATSGNASGMVYDLTRYR